MGVINVKSQTRSIYVFIVWLVIVIVELGVMILLVNELNSQLVYLMPAANRSIDSEEYSRIISIQSEIDAHRSEFDNTSNNYSEIIENQRQEVQRSILLCKCSMMIILIYGIVGILLFFVCRNRRLVKVYMLIVVFICVMVVVEYAHGDMVIMAYGFR